jgi:HJR/Mrr/RecB family endonuclease
VDKFQTINSIVNNYLRHSPEGWHKFVFSLGKKIGNSVNLELADPRNIRPIQKAPEFVSKLIISKLMSPETAQIIGSCDSYEQAEEIIVETIADNLRFIEIKNVESDLGQIVDIADVGFIQTIHAIDTIDDWYGGERSGFSTFSAWTATYEDINLKDIISDLILEINQLQPPKESALIRLDLIDSALYKALIADPKLLKALNWRVFEELIEDILCSFGYEVELKKGTKDGGIDLIAIKNKDILGGHRYLIQAKRYKNNVGVEPVRQLLFLHGHHKATKSCIACTAHFTRGAWNLAQQYKYQLDLKDMNGVAEWLRKAAKLKGIDIKNF